MLINYCSESSYDNSSIREEIGMPTFLTVALIVLGLVGLIAGLLIWLFFHQGGCCVKKTAAKAVRKCSAPPAT